MSVIRSAIFEWFIWLFFIAMACFGKLWIFPERGAALLRYFGLEGGLW
jgi:hypothetical protein